MPKSLICAGPGAVTVGGGYLSAFQDSYLLSINGSESIVKQVVRNDGTYSKMYVVILTNTRNGDSVFKLRKNGADGNLVVTVPAGCTGVFSDLTHTDTVVAGDEVAFSCAYSGGSTGSSALQSISAEFKTVGASVTPMSHYSFGYNIASSSRKYGITDPGGALTVTESIVQHKVKLAGTYKKLTVTVSGNARTNDTTIKSRKNGADGNMSVVVPAGTTGTFADIANTDTVVADDLICYQVSGGAGTEIISFETSITKEASGNETELLNALVPTVASAAGAPVFFAPSVYHQSSVEFSVKRMYLPFAATFSKPTLNIGTNTLTGSSTFRLKKGGTTGQSNKLVDGNMEAADSSAWTQVGSVTLSKETSSPAEGSRWLKIVHGGGTRPGVSQSVLTFGRTYFISGWAKGDGTNAPLVVVQEGGSTTTLWTGTTSTSWQYFSALFYCKFYTTPSEFRLLNSTASVAGNFVGFDGVSILEENSAVESTNLATDGDMEAAGIASWTAGSSATVTKETGTPHGGSQCLRVAYGGVANPYALQANMIAGNTYILSGWARGDGTNAPRLAVDGATNVWTGTSSTSWQQFNVTVTPSGGNNLYLVAVASAAGYAEFDDIVVQRESAPFGNISITIPASTTGWFEDLTNTDTVNAGEYVYFSLDPANTGTSLAIRGLNLVVDGGSDATGGAVSLALLGVGA